MRTYTVVVRIFLMSILVGFHHQAHAMKLHQEPLDKLLKKLKNFREQERIWEDAQQEKFLRNKAPITVDDSFTPGTIELDENLSELFKVIAFLEDDAQETRDQKIFLAATIPFFLNCTHAYFLHLLLEMARAEGRNIFVKMVTTPLRSGATKLHTAVACQQRILVHEILKQVSNFDREAFLAVVNAPYHHTTPCYAAATGDSLEIFQDFLLHARNLGSETFRAMINASNGRTSLVDYVRLRPDPQWFTVLQEHADALHINIRRTLHQSTYQKPLPASFTSHCTLS